MEEVIELVTVAVVSVGCVLGLAFALLQRKKSDKNESGS